MRIALAQLNSIIGDFKGNLQKMLSFCKKAIELKAEIIVFPEMCLSGYPPMDLLDQADFRNGCLKAVEFLQKEAPAELLIVFGYIAHNHLGWGKPFVNVVSAIWNNKIIFTQAKSLLPTYDVFDEARYFEPATERRVFNFKGKKLGIAICEDIWWEKEHNANLQYPIDPVKDLLEQGAEILLIPSASPFFADKPLLRKNLLTEISQQNSIFVCYVNMVGANDSLIFDGQSMYFSRLGQLEQLAKPFAEDLILVDTEKNLQPINFNPDRYLQIEHALILGIKDYLAKCGFFQVHLGLSGGIDSALVAVLATKAVGPEKVTTFGLPSRYSSKGSIEHAQELAKRLGINYKIISIEEIYSNYLQSLEKAWGKFEPDVTEENLQARIRATILMAYANRFHSVLLNTGNKSELATGYCTLYGDMCGSLAVIGDLFKTEVYALARRINDESKLIPEEIFTKAPSAELNTNQTDQDTLPPYDILDKILQDYLLENFNFQQLLAKGYDAKIVEQVLKMVAQAEYKRRQTPPVLKVSPKTFGLGRRIPIARKILEIDF